MITLFSTPKPFRGHIKIIQRNAISSWTRLQPRPDIILFGDDEGTADVANEFGARHVPEVACNEYGTPLVNDLFEKAQRLATADVLCYVNADIILMSDFTQAVAEVGRRKRRFLMVGQRWDVDVDVPLDFELDWEQRLRAHVSRHGQLHPSCGIDYFVFPLGIWGKIPPFAIGRTAWDNWLVYRARDRGAAVVDATRAVTAVHQNHDYTHIPDGIEGVRNGPEAQRNLDLAKYLHVFTLDDATWLLIGWGLVPALTPWHLWRHLSVWLAYHPHLRSRLSAVSRLLWPLRRISRAIVGRSAHISR